MALICAGFHVHQPEDGFPIPREENAMMLLKRQLGGMYLYPVHRLDRPTSGKGHSVDISSQLSLFI